MQRYEMGEAMSDEDSLAHYGVKGMTWGQRRHIPDASGVTRAHARIQKKLDNRQLGRKLEDFESSSNRSNEIRSARGNRVAAKRKYEDVKSELKAQKGTGQLGKNAYKVAINKARNERYETIYKADSKTTGEQLVEAIFNAGRAAGAASAHR